MRRGVFFVGSVILAAAAGCASRAPSAEPAAKGSAPATTRAIAAAADDPAFLALDQIHPVPKLPEAKRPASTQPIPVDALVWYAQGRDALARGEGGREPGPMTSPGDFAGSAGTGGEVKNQDRDAQ